MSVLQSMSELSDEEIRNIFDSIDYVFFDLDGVLVRNKTLIDGAVDCVAKLRKLKKNIAFVSNNTAYPQSKLAASLQIFGATLDEIVTPNAALLYYLKKIDFTKDIYMIGTVETKRLLREAGYNLIEYKDIQSSKLKENISALEELSLKTLEVCQNVGAVFVDLDSDFCTGILQAAKAVLNHMDDVLFLTGITDDTININKTLKLIGPKYFIDALERWTNMQSIAMGKPGLALKDELNSKFNISDDSRVLFLGDNMDTDIAFGVNCGYQTCLVLSGVTTEHQVKEWKYSEHLKPTYVVRNVGDLYEKIKDL